MKNKIKHTVKGSNHWRALNFLRVFRAQWFSPRKIEHALDMWYISLGRRLREDVKSGVLKVRHSEGFAEYKYRGNK